MPKKIKAIVKVQIQAGQANPAPPLGPALAQHGLNISEFCQKFNDATKNQMGFKLPLEITIYEDRSYNFKIKQPPAVELLKKAAAIEKGSGTPNKKKVAKIEKKRDEFIKYYEDLKKRANLDELVKAIKDYEEATKIKPTIIYMNEAYANEVANKEVIGKIDALKDMKIIIDDSIKFGYNIGNEWKQNKLQEEK